MLRKVKISGHAMLRLRERVQSYQAYGYRSWNEMVRTARYKGRTYMMMDNSTREWYDHSLEGINHSNRARCLN